MASAEEFIKQWISSGLITQPEIDDFLATVSNPPRTPEDVAKYGVRHNRLTRFQAQMIYQGKGNSLILGNYEIQEKLGQGAMGQVFRAVHRRMKRQVALKVLAGKLVGSARALERFHREVEAAARLTHPHIVTAFDADKHKGIHYYVMELVEGKDLASIVRATGPLSVERAVDVIIQAARGLGYAHDHGVLHRDVKPANMLLSTEGQVKILDMGLACLSDNEGVADHGLTGTGVIMGTVDFMAPEQGVNTKNADARADQYSLGATLFYLLTGEPIYKGETAVEKILAHRDQPIPDLQQIRPDVPAYIARVFAKMVAKRPEERYPSLADVITALEANPGNASQGSTDDALQEFLRIREVESMPTLLGPSPQATLAPSATKTAARQTVPKKASDQETLQSEFLSDTQTLQPDKVTPRQPKTRSRKLAWILTGAAAVALLLGGFLIRIRNKDGTTAEIRVPEGATVEIVQSADQPPSGDSPEDPREIDVVSERQAARWVQTIGGSGTWIDAIHGTTGHFDSESVLPYYDFALLEVYLTNNSRVTDEELVRLSRCRRLEKLELTGTSLQGPGLRHLTAIKSLVSLSIGALGERNLSDRVNLSDDELAPLAQMPQLKSLELNYNTSLTDNALSHLAGLVNLEFLNLHGIPGITDQGLAHLGQLRKLRNICLTPHLITDAGVSAIVDRNPDLEEIHIGTNDGVVSQTLAPLRTAQNLKKVLLSGDQLTPDGLEVLKSRPKLEALEVSVPVTDNSLASLLQLPNLKWIGVYYWKAGQPVPHAGYQALAAHPGVEHLKLHGSSGSPNDQDLLRLVSLPALRVLKVGFETSFEPRNYTTDWIPRFRELRPDVHLSVDGTDYPAAADPGTVQIPPLPPVQPGEESLEGSDPQQRSSMLSPLSLPSMEGLSIDGKNSVRPVNNLAPENLRLRSADAGNLRNGQRSVWNLRAGTPLSDQALMSRPARIGDLLSWSIEQAGHRGYVTSVDVSSQDLIATGGHDCSVRLWTKDWKLVRVLLGHTHQVHSVVFSPDGNTLATTASSPDNTVRLWDVHTGKLILSRSLPIWFGRLTWSPNGKTLAICSSQNLVLLDPEAGRIIESPEKLSSNLSEATWSPDGSQLAVVGEYTGQLKILDVPTLTTKNFAKVAQPGQGVAWSPDSQRIALVGPFATQVWKANPLTNEVVLEHGGTHVCWSPDGRYLTVGGNALQVWDVPSWRVISPQIGGSLGLAFSPDGSYLLNGGRQIETETWTLLNQQGSSTSGPARIALSPDGRHVASQGNSGIRIWDSQTGHMLKKSSSPGKQALGLHISPKGDQILRIQGTADSVPEVLGLEGDEKLLTFTGHEGIVWSGAWSPDGTEIATAGEDGTVRVWNARTGSLMQTLVHGSPVWWVCWAPQGHLVASVQQSQVTVWLANTAELKREFPGLPSVYRAPNQGISLTCPVSFTRDGKAITTIGQSDQIESLDIESGRRVTLGQIHVPGNGPRDSLAWSPNGQLLCGYTVYRDVEILKPGSKDVAVFRWSQNPQWYPDSRRIIGGDNYVTAIYGYDVGSMRRLGTLIPELGEQEYATISPQGHVYGSEKAFDWLVYVALHRDGTMTTYSATEFAEKFGWKNDPAKSRLLELDR